MFIISNLKMIEKLISCRINWSAKRVLSLFIVWTAIWLTILVWKMDLLSNKDKNISYRINTAGCRIKDSLGQFKNYLIWLRMPFLYVPACPSRQFTVKNRKVHLANMTGKVSCSVMGFERFSDERNFYGSNQDSEKPNFGDFSNQTVDFFQLECFDDDFTEIMFRDYGFLTPTVESKPDIKSFKVANNTYSVLLLGLDKITHEDVDSQLKRTVTFLREQPNFFDFKGFNGLGANASSNMLAILTGRTEFKKYGKNERFFFDKSDFAWKTYSAKKFYTIFGENNFGKSLFNSPGRNFKQQPTDYYVRPFLVETASDCAFEPAPKVVTIGEVTESNPIEEYFRYRIPQIEEKCKGSRHEQHIALELMEQFLPFYLERLTFSFFWFSKRVPFLPQDDAAIEKLLMIFKESGIFKRFFIFFVSNIHDFNAKKLGQTQWIKQPILYALIPEDFEKYNPTAYEHFKANVDRLTTPYDLHATLLQLADFDLYAKNATPKMVLINGRLRPFLYGISLLNETITVGRTCKEANIPSQYCLCENDSE